MFTRNQAAVMEKKSKCKMTSYRFPAYRRTHRSVLGVSERMVAKETETKGATTVMQIQMAMATEMEAIMKKLLYRMKILQMGATMIHLMTSFLLK